MKIIKKPLNPVRVCMFLIVIIINIIIITQLIITEKLGSLLLSTKLIKK